MNGEFDAADDVAFLAASGHRACILAALYRDGPLSKDDLVERTGAARVTVGRNLARLQDRGVVVEESDRYRLSIVGKPVVADFLALAETVSATDGLGAVLDHVPPASFDLDPRELADADVTVASRADPYAPVDRHEESLRAADDVCALLPAVGAAPMETHARRVVDEGATVELVVTPAVAETLREGEFATLVDRMAATGRFEAYVYDGGVPYYLGIVDGRVQLGVDDGGVPQALLESDSEAVREWARSTYADYRAAGRPLPVDGG